MAAPETRQVLRPLDEEGIRLAKTLLRTARFGALATIDPASGHPMATRVAVATDSDGAPIILISELSAHTGALRQDQRCGLLLGEPGKGDPLAHPRLSLRCMAEPVPAGDARRERVERRYLYRHPKAKLYAGFADFTFMRLTPVAASLNGGFGKAYELASGDLLADHDIAGSLSAAEQSAVDHMNSDHADAIANYATFYCKAGPGNWRISGLDPEGADLVDGDKTARMFFPKQVQEPRQLHEVLVQMAREARTG